MKSITDIISNTGSHIVVLGGGESGVGAALLAHRKGFSVFLSDIGAIKETFRKELKLNAIDFEDETHTETEIFKANLVIKSPGIPDGVPMIQALRKAGIPVVDELEFASYFTNSKIIAITGSNGKTTTTRLIGHIMQNAGLNASVGGNIGDSFARQVIEDKADYYVLEMSSFQLDNIVNFRPDVAVLLNITPDHLDRYQNKMDGYIASKFRITMNQTNTDTFIYNSSDENIKAYSLGREISAARSVAVEMPPEETADTINIYSLKLQLQALPLQGRHNIFNASCAVLAVVAIGLSDEQIEKGLLSFKNDAHRLETVAEKRGVTYINDSKATNVDAVYYALEAMTRPIVWIAGGTDKGNVYDVLKPLIQEKVKALVCLGKDNKKLVNSFENILDDIVETNDASDAVYHASLLADEGDVVLLSPACASFDLFNNYEDRGNQFKKAVNNL